MEFYIKNYSKTEYTTKVCMALAGRAAEQVTFGRVTTGASNDLQRVTQIVYQMVQVYGMNDKVGQVAFPKFAFYFLILKKLLLLLIEKMVNGPKTKCTATQQQR
jgi:ATP-dependent Zn protease